MVAGVRLLMGLLMLVTLSSAAKADIGAYVVVDAGSGAVMDSKDATRLWYPASLTKMMTAYVTFKAVHQGRAKLTSIVMQSPNSRAEPPSKMGFKVGTKFTIDTALKIILVKSANDVAVALGEAIAGSEEAFIEMMNAEAKRLGMADTVFVNPHGLPDNRQVTTARDMAILALALRRDFPESRTYYNHPALQFGKKTLRSANKEFLLRVPGANGMKTGYICNAGYNVAASATRRGRTILVVVLGAASGLERTAFARDALDQAFEKRGGNKSLTSLRDGGGQPPADGYCKRNPKPGLKGIIAQYDLGSSEKPSVLSYAKSKPGAVLMPVLTQKSAAPKASDLSEFKLPNGKTDWSLVLDRTLGVERVAYAPVRIGVGAPSGAEPPRASQWAEGQMPIDIPLPRAHPSRAAMVVEQGIVTADPVGDIPPAEALAPVQLRPGIPVPAPSPKS
ncbi:D-alanyl-D-alanine carboxypeptidase [Roseibium sp. CAU 1637]|uniref:D-alanyl-D-alanine carboxypeptidase n=2 Tax=Stappiaceae TaxID=2821832 RepID=A0A939ET30_9HYPH|nr:D-alanyl-D-alanine carboxypeptidase [Roseibium limicola]